MGLWVAGDLFWEIQGWIHHTAPPFPYVADWFYIAGYPVGAAGLYLWSRARIHPQGRGPVIDAAIITSALGIVVWAFLIKPYADATGLAIGVRFAAIAYPLGDVLLVYVTLRLLVGPHLQGFAYRLLLTGLLTVLAADLAYGWLSLQGLYTGGGLADAGWLLSYVAIGAAALHPSAHSMTKGLRSARDLSFTRLSLLGASLLVVPFLVAWTGKGPVEGIEHFVIVGGSVVLVLLVLARLMDLVRQIHAQVAQLNSQRAVLEEALEERRELHARLEHQVMHDPLTDLANRPLFTDRLEQALKRSARNKDFTAVLFLDMDDFKSVNDTFGHAAGDALLCQIGDRVRDSLRSADTAARFGGDEFVLLLEAVQRDSEAILVAERLLQALSLPFEIGTQMLTMDASIGIATSSGDLIAAEELLSRADTAMYTAKRSGKNRCELYRMSMQMSEPA